MDDDRGPIGAVGPLLVLFGGAGREAIIERLWDAGHDIVGVIAPSSASEALERSLDTIAGLGLEITRVTRAAVGDELGSRRARVLLSVGFPYLIPTDRLGGYEHAVNVHPTLLPKFRGPTTGAYVLLDGAAESGSTVHIIDDGADTGPIVLQRAVPITRFDTVRSVQRRVYEIEPGLTLDALDLLTSPGFTPTVQDESLASEYPTKRTPGDSRIDPNRPLIELWDSIRACDPDRFPAFFEVDGQRVCVRLWRPDRPADDGDDTV